MLNSGDPALAPNIFLSTLFSNTLNSAPLSTWEIQFLGKQAERENFLFLKWIITCISYVYSAFNFFANVVWYYLLPLLPDIWIYPHFQTINFQLGSTIFWFFYYICSVSSPSFFAPHTLFSTWRGLKRSEEIPGAPAWRWGEWIWLAGSSGLHRNSPQGINISSIRVFEQIKDPKIPITLRPQSIYNNC